MTNDLYDTYKDTKEGIYTFANAQRALPNIELIYLNQKKLLNNSISKLPVSKSEKLKFAIKISVISAFGDIALQQLKGINNNSNTLPNFDQIPRESLIIDMEKMVNRYRLINFAFKNGKLWM
jgi:hypothetical protein